LPDRFFTRLQPAPVAAPRLVRLNTKLALDLGLDPERLATSEGVEMLAGSLVFQGGEPLAVAYAGHQFGLSSLNSVMDAPFCLARSSTAPVCAATMLWSPPGHRFQRARHVQSADAIGS
jgi:protein adenylyltransferase SelO-like protein